MKIIQALPRRMAFEARHATSVELCVSEWVSGSRYRADTTVFAERSDAAPLLDGVDVFRLDPVRTLSSWHLAASIRRQIKAKGYQLIVTQQHIPTAARIALFNRSTPVVLQTHNFIDPPVAGRGAPLRNRLRQFELQSLAGITLVSEATRVQFEKDWPAVKIPRAVISNSFDFSTWNAGRAKQEVIVVVGRTQDAKGIAEAAEGASGFLKAHPTWRAVFILSEPQADPAYFERVKAALAPAGGQAEILTGISFARVREITETAAISIVASKWIEPFGRTALEAHASGTALISSGTGGLREISGDAAYFLDEVSATAIETALTRLAADPALRQRLGEEGAKRVRRMFSVLPVTVDGQVIPSMAAKLDDFYDRVLAISKAGR